MRKINPIYLDGIARAGGRLAQLHIDVDIKHPIIMPQRSHLTEVVIRQHHDKLGHACTGHTWASLRQRFWIVKVAAAVRHSIGQCIKCKRRNASVGKQLIADLPGCRVQTDKPPFYKVGVDYFGPFLVKQGKSWIKRYGCIFSYLTTRAVHIEVASDLSTDSSINALKRFITRRGQPNEIFCDNGTDFVGAERVLRKSLQSLQQSKLNNFCLQLEIKWCFNPLYAIHIGGAWERMIRSVRRILNALTQMQTLTEKGLITLMTEMEGILNSRPLVPLMLHDFEKDPLTPNDLLLQKGNPNLPPGTFDTNSYYTRRHWAQVQFPANQFWRRWAKEFLPNLLQRQKWFNRERNFDEGDVVLLAEDMQHRSNWIVGRVLRILTDKEGLVRVVQVKARNPVLTRSVTKLCLIEKTAQ